MATKTLGDLYSRFVARSNYLVQKFETPLPLPSDPTHRAICDAVQCDGRALMLIKLQFIWGEFCRELITRSAIGGYQTISGTMVRQSSSVTSHKDVQDAIDKQGGNRPPAWHVPSFAVGVAKRLGTQNFRQITLALGLTSPVDDLRKARNYIVHPWKDTRIQYEQVVWKFSLSFVDPVSLLTARLPGGATRFEAWVDDFQMMVLEAVR